MAAQTLPGSERISSQADGSRRRIASVQVCRGLAALAVVVSHLHNVETKYFHTHLLQLAQFGVLGVDVFFVISGVVIAIVTSGHFGEPRFAGRFLLHRLLRIYPVYWFYSLVILLAFLINPRLAHDGTLSVFDLPGSFTLLPSGRPFLLLQGWTLTYELCFYLIMAVLLLLPRLMMPICLALWAALVLIQPLVGWFWPTEIGFLYTNPLILEFLSGVLLWYLLRRSCLHPAFGVGLLSASLLWLAGVVVWSAHRFGPDQTMLENSYWLRTLTFGVFAVLFLAGAMELERARVVQFARFFERIGDWSYSIYLSHLILLELISRALAPALHDRPLGMLIVTLLSVPLVILLGWFSFRWLEQPLIRLMRRQSPSQTASA